ncbi:hypothetical protein ElyMa_005672900, partial [Elysia marginata]
VRKARKLVELMEKLAMEVSPEEMELTIPAIPQLSNFTAVATLHDPNSPHHPLNLAQQHHEEQQQQQPLSPGKSPEQQQLDKEQGTQHQPGQEQGQDQTQLQKQPEEPKTDSVSDIQTKVGTTPLPEVSREQQQQTDNNTESNTNKPEKPRSENTSASPSWEENTSTVSATSETTAVIVTAEPNLANPSQPSSEDLSSNSVEQSTMPADNNNKGECVYATKGETVQNGNALSEQASTLEVSTAPVQDQAKGWLNPFS